MSINDIAITALPEGVRIEVVDPNDPMTRAASELTGPEALRIADILKAAVKGQETISAA